MKKTISFYTLGCRLNQSETAVIEHSFESEGYRIVDFNEPADVVVINTCTVTENGDADTRRLVHKVSRLNPKTRIALIGCQAQTQKEKLAAWPNICWVIGNAKKMDLALIMKELSGEDGPQVITPPISRESFTVPISGVDKHHTRPNIKIQDGCDFFCSFCEIPYARGRARSRVFEDILLEANALVANGYKEIVITGINIGTYKFEGRTLLDVIDALEQIDGLQRIRLSSIEPTTIPKLLIEKMRPGSKLCRYLHVPLQSASDEILSSMKRKYTFAEFNDFIQMAHALVPGICLGTDVIVGFPGETEKEFQTTFERLLDSPVHYFHVFSYSERHLAHSRTFLNVVRQSIIQKRSQVLRELSEHKRRTFYEGFIGKTVEVLFEERKNGFYSGITDNYLRVCVLAQSDLVNRTGTVLLERVEGLKLMGNLH